jgi:TonB-linked SusC/RagA family outer membrane protein
MKKLSLVMLVLLTSIGAALAQRTVTGTVMDATTDDPLIGASILVEGTTSGTVTDIEGAFTVRVPENANTLIVSYTGYQTKKVAIGASNQLDIQLEQDVIGLESVVVVGYGEQSNKYKVQSISQVNSDQIENVPAIGPQQLLQGNAAGVQMFSTSGVVGSAPAVRIRGVASINAGGQPLYVVDGVPLNTGNYSNGLGAVALNPLQDINPNDIESISVLKDAAAVAIYGSRGANGVILINTKKGKPNQDRITFDYYTGWSEPTGEFEMLSADQFRGFMSDYNGVDPASLPQGGFDWVNGVERTGRLNNYSVSMNGGSDKTQYFVSAGYQDQEGYIIGNDFERINGRLNLKHTVNERFRFGANIGVSRALNDRINSDNSTFAPYTSARLQLPYVLPRDEDGQYVNTGFIANVFAIEDLAVVNLVTRRTTGNLYAMFDIVPNKLTFRSDFGADMVQTEETIREPEIVSPGGYGYRRILQDNKWLTTNTLNYTEEFGNSFFEALAGMSFETSRLQSTTVEGSDFAADALRNIASAATPTTTFASRTEWALFSQFLRLNFRHNDRYLLEASIRRDGSSRFGEDNRYGTFWAVGAGWIISEESFMQGSFFDNLKLSASYGTSGNDQIANFASRGLYGSGVASDYAGSPGLRPIQAANPALQWEETAQLDVGLSAAMFDSRLNFELSVYQKTTSDMLLEFQLPTTSGFESIVRNAAEMENRGVDLSITSVNVRRPNFEWTTNFNVGYLQNEVTNLPEAAVDDQGRRFLNGSANQRAIEGESVNTFFLIRYNGVNPETGDAEWLDAEGNITLSPTSADRVIVGSAIPDFTGGLTNTFRYKDLSLSAFFSFVSGNKIYLGEYRFTDGLTGGGFNKSIDVLDYWQQPGDNSFAPASDSPTADAFAQRSTAQLFNGSFIRLRNLTLAYRLRGSALNTNAFRSIRLYVMGQNLLTIKDSDFRGPDPEINGQGQNNQIQGESFFTPPQARTITVGATVQF